MLKSRSLQARWCDGKAMWLEINFPHSRSYTTLLSSLPEFYFCFLPPPPPTNHVYVVTLIGINCSCFCNFLAGKCFIITSAALWISRILAISAHCKRVAAVMVKSYSNLITWWLLCCKPKSLISDVQCFY